MSKKLAAKPKAEPDRAVREIAADPTVGEAKVGDLAGVQVHKFRMNNQLTLLAYTHPDDQTIQLLTLGSHENFCRDLKR